MGALLESKPEIQASDVPERRPARLSFGLKQARLIREKHARGEIDADEAERQLRLLKRAVSKKASGKFWVRRSSN